MKAGEDHKAHSDGDVAGIENEEGEEEAIGARSRRPRGAQLGIRGCKATEGEGKGQRTAEGKGC